MASWLLLGLGAVAALQAMLLLWGLLLLAGDRNLGVVRTWVTLLQLVGSALVVWVAVTAVAYLMWLYRAVSNINSLGLAPLSTSPTMAVVWWFVPVAFLFKPFLTVRDLHRRLASEGTRAIPFDLVLWWGGWVGGALLGRYAAVLPVDTADDARTWLVISLAAVVAWAVSATLGARALLAMVRGEEACAGALDLSSVESGDALKTCPDCAEQVRFAARVCRFCGYRFEQS